MTSRVTPSKARLLQLAELSSKIFQTTFNPEGVRTGSKILSRGLKGPVLASYYGPTNFPKLKDFKQFFPPGTKVIDATEQKRLAILEGRKKRGKGAPKKKNAAPSDTGKKGKKK